MDDTRIELCSVVCKVSALTLSCCASKNPIYFYDVVRDPSVGTPI